MFTKRRLAASGLAVAAMSAAIPFVLPSAAYAATPPWETDPNALGNVAFYDAAGNVIHGGSNLKHLADYVAGDTAGTSGSTKATFYFAAPDHNQPDETQWATFDQSLSTTYPTTTAPASINALTGPVVTLSSGDADFTDTVGGVTPDSTTGYANIFQVRVYDTHSAPKYWESDIQVDTNAGTWQQIYPSVLTSTTTTISDVTPASPQTQGTSVTFTATVAPIAAGSVQFKNNGTNLGAAVAVNTGDGTAQLTTSALPVGDNSITAVFTPTDTNTYSGSTSAPVIYHVNQAPPAWQPVLSGPHRIGSVDSCLASFSGASTVTYSWAYNGITISGATASTYKIADSWYGTHLTCSVTATNGAGSVSGTSNSVVVGAGGPLAVTTRPYEYNRSNRTFAYHGVVESCSPGAWSPPATSYSFAWYVNTARVSTAASFKPTSTEIGKRLYCVVTAHRLHYANGVYKTAGLLIK